MSIRITMTQQTDHIGDINKKVTAVEWLINELDLSNDPITMKAINKAKAMEKQQIIEAYNNGENRSAELYYNDTYGK